MRTIVADFAAGWLAGGAGLLVGHPLDTVKVRLQTLDAHKGYARLATDTLRKEALAGFYKGLAAPLVTTGLMHSLLFAGYGQALRWLHDDAGGRPPALTHVVLASNVGAAVQCVLAIPVDVVKVKLQVQKANVGHLLWNRERHAAAVRSRSLYASPLDCAAKLLRQYGLARGLYMAGWTHCARDMVGFNFYIPVYELCRRRMAAHGAGDVPATLAAGAAAGIAGWLSILPLDVVKNRRRTGTSRSSTASSTAPASLTGKAASPRSSEAATFSH